MHFLAAKNDVPMTLACPVVGKQIVWNKSVQISSVTRFWISVNFSSKAHFCCFVLGRPQVSLLHLVVSCGPAKTVKHIVAWKTNCWIRIVQNCMIL